MIVENVFQDKGMLRTDETISNSWYYHFMERQSYLLRIRVILLLAWDGLHESRDNEEILKRSDDVSTIQVKFIMLTKLACL